jgi:hypothetical protein
VNNKKQRKINSELLIYGGIQKFGTNKISKIAWVFVQRNYGRIWDRRLVEKIIPELATFLFLILNNKARKHACIHELTIGRAIYTNCRKENPGQPGNPS